VVAYSPLGRGALLADLRKPAERRIKLLIELAEKYSKTPVQVALNWVIWHDQVVAIPKALQRQHLQENAGAAGWKLMKEDYDSISRTW
jgi:diketogulonate reductase-like aldo/keto reductase